MNFIMKIAKVVLIGLIAGIAVFMIFGPKIAEHYQKKYYKANYQPESVDTYTMKAYPESYHIDGIPWFSYKKAYCQPAALQMVAGKNGINKELGYFNFLTGFTYGAFYRRDVGILYPYTDPIPGYIAASPHLGLKMRYFVTDSRETFLKAVKFYISRGYPVIAELDAGKLWGDTEFIAHSEMIVGYDKNQFEYYETGKEDKYRNNAKGIMVDEQKMSDAVQINSKNFIHPWKYAFMIFEKSEKKEDLKDIWSRNGKSMVGMKMGVMTSGSFAMHQLVMDFAKSGKLKYDASMDAIGYTRMDNAKFLAGYFKGDKDIEDASRFLLDESGIYEENLKVVVKGVTGKEEIKKYADRFENAALLEKQAGEIFLKKAGTK